MKKLAKVPVGLEVKMQGNKLFQNGLERLYRGELGLIKGDTRRLDYSSHMIPGSLDHHRGANKIPDFGTFTVVSLGTSLNCYCNIILWSYCRILFHSYRPKETTV